MVISRFEDIESWRGARQLAGEIYGATHQQPFAKDFGLRDQIRRAAVSVCSNIAEGDARQTGKESVQFFFIAKGSLAEVSAQLEIAAEVYALPVEKIETLQRECDELGAMLQGLIDHRRK